MRRSGRYQTFHKYKIPSHISNKILIQENDDKSNNLNQNNNRKKQIIKFHFLEIISIKNF